MKFYKILLLPLLVSLGLLTGCATPVKTPGGYALNVTSFPPIQIVNVKTHVQSYGLVITGSIHLAPDLLPAVLHSVDVIVIGTDGKGLGKFTSAYYPAPKPNKKKEQHAHFTVVMHDVPPGGSTIEIELTPQPVPDQPVPVNPI